ncbi:unnamed protein product [Fraxinus pennsylvanica]|uniref:Protein kinase domain-containing protein n=1 Tax=Fraxinus pennsylvanica TaxID=56036 RepID=A0AAD2A6T1_9LAMI|nr:unnamed protein product [Fraxinus pennsylvanica]
MVATLIDLSVNQFLGSIPTRIGDLQSLVNLSLAHNILQGFILELMGKLLNLERLDLNHNNLSGICGDPLYGLPPCHTIGNGRQRRRKVMLGVVFALSGTIALIIVAMALACAVKSYRRKNLGESITDFAPPTTLSRVSYYELMQTTEGHSESHLLGSETFGFVYRGTLNNGRDVAIVHCDLKPSNVLLDDDMVAHLCDFGIAKLLDEGESNTHTTTLGTLGYIAPEYGLEGLVSIRSDVYSYGIMLMEIFTSMNPSSEKFSGELSLRSWINDSMPNAITQIIDSNLLALEGEYYTEKLKCLSSIMELALNCSMESANERVNMKEVVVALKKIR